MSLYNILNGVDNLAPKLIRYLNISVDQVPRFRDCYLEDGKIVIYTRTGGGNRDYYESENSCRTHYPEYFKDTEEQPSGPWNDGLRSHPNYLSDQDDEFDQTYCKFYFSFPSEHEDELKELAARIPKSKARVNWEKLGQACAEEAKARGKLTEWQLLDWERYFVGNAMRKEGGHFFKMIGESLAYADQFNVNKVKTTWPAEWQQYLERGKKLFPSDLKAFEAAKEVRDE